MTTAFQDPFYLRYKYRPDCELHKTTLSTQQATQAKATTLKPHHRTHKTERSRVLKEKEVLGESKPASLRKSKTASSAENVSSSGMVLVLTMITTLLQWEMHKR